MILVNDRDRVPWHAGMTVQDLLGAMNYTYVLITVMVDDVLVPQEDYHHREIPDGARVTVFHLAHGG
ncbi:MAG TPA: sulfur carrier protein ThiS [Candidatus Krumholzibacteria bacterium]|nr:sulfur carrier protein ThiS [Candidatus Krumholzibacteria bacterium]HPD70266.1 sulfur carrier protein ThiS [Candidatus Krumholzibacteria bacterium]HRY40034.1 sulfur carrier protein ThiS [Candidatus Krumholzibacteria bacterium]